MCIRLFLYHLYFNHATQLTAWGSVGKPQSVLYSGFNEVGGVVEMEFGAFISVDFHPPISFTGVYVLQ